MIQIDETSWLKKQSAICLTISQLTIPHLVAPQRHLQTTSLFWCDGLVKKLLDVPLWGFYYNLCRLPRLLLSPRLFFSCSFLLPSKMFIVVYHMPLLFDGQIGQFALSASKFDVLKQGLNLLVSFGSRKMKGV